MAAETNGRPKEVAKANGLSNGHAITRKPSVKRKTKSSLIARGLSTTSRLLVWYTLITALFRCPSSAVDLTDDSPRVCKPYTEARSYIAPHVKPFYDLYASPYVETARPYAGKFNRHVYHPSISFGEQIYNAYGAPRVNQIRGYTYDQWEQTLKPRIDAAQAQAIRQYGSTLAPQVSKVSAAATPYYDGAKENVLHIYNEQIIYAYTKSRPYAEKIYGYVHDVAIESGLPYAQLAWTSTAVFIDRSLWPWLRVLYGENVEPQLFRIRERLGRYRDGKNLKATADDIVASISSSSISSSLYSISSSIASAYTTKTSASVATATSSPDTPSISLTPEQEAEQTREKIENDLKNWQEKFAKAADKGTQDLQERVKEITDRQIESQVFGVGEALITQLEESSSKELTKLKNAIKKIVASIPNGKSNEDLKNAEIELFKATRSAGESVKGKAQALRSWKQRFEQETRSLVAAASESTLEVIDNIRDLGLQEIGMRWAWMEDVTYKDWSNYHLLKKTFDKWRQEIEAVSQYHEGLQRGTEAANNLEDRGMTIAEAAAKELSRVKEVGKWKIQASDSSDDFSTRYIPPVAAAIGSNVNEKISSVSDQIIGSSQGSLESIVSQATEKANEAASGASSKFLNKDPGVVEQASSKISEVSTAVFSTVDKIVSGTPQPKANSIAAAMKKKADQVVADASEAFVGTPAHGYESYTSRAVENAQSVGRAISEAVSGSSTPIGESASSSASSIVSSATSIVSQASRKFFAGAMAQKVGEQKPILDDVISDDDDATYSERLQEVVNRAGDKYADITRAVSEALLKATNTQGSVESVTSVADAQYSSALAAASSALYGTQQGTAESITSLVSEKYADAVAAASSIIFGTPVPVTQSIAAQASSVYSDAVSRAQEQYSRAKSIASAQISGSPKPVHQDIYSSIENAYSGSLAAASKRMQAALESASTLVYGTPLSPQESILSVAQAKYSTAAAAASSQYDAAKSAIGSSSTPGYESLLSKADKQYSDLINAASSGFASATAAAFEVNKGPDQGILESITSLASARLADSLSVASAQYSSIKTAVGATPTPVHQQYAADAQRRYYEAVGMAHERYSEFLAAASSAVYGTPTPAHKSLYSVASESLYGKATPTSQSFIDAEKIIAAAKSRYSIVASQATDNLQKLIASASSVAGKDKKPPHRSLLDSASSQWSSAVSAASASFSSVSAAAVTGIYGTPTGMAESLSSVISEKVGTISSAASTALRGTETPWTASIASQASENWEALVSKASEQVYGAPTPFSDLVVSQVGEYAAQATSAAAAQYEAVQLLISELVSGKEPDFTESVRKRLSSAYYTGIHVSIASSASSYASDAYASVASVASSVFTPPATLEAIINAANDQLGAAVEAASIQYYGSSKGTYEKATSAAASSYSSAQSIISEAVYGTQPGYLDSISKSFEDIAHSAQNAISAAIYSTSTGATASITGAVQNAYASASSVVANNAAAASAAVDGTKAKISEAIYGPEQGALESAVSQISAAVESAKARLAQLPEGASDALDAAKSGIEDIASSVSSVAAAATDKIRDEL